MCLQSPMSFVIEWGGMGWWYLVPPFISSLFFVGTPEVVCVYGEQVDSKVWLYKR